MGVRAYIGATAERQAIRPDARIARSGGPAAHQSRNYNNFTKMNPL
jgi:hypothetical protein